MATKYLDLDGLTRYDGKIKNVINTTATGLSSRITTLENAEFITKAVNNLENYYKKAETYSQAEVNALVAGLATINITVVESLPDTGASNIIYLVAHSHGTGDSYDEYIWVASANKFEKIGSTDIDLSGYVLTSRTINGHALTSNVTITKTDLSLGNVVNTGDSAVPVENGTTKFTTGGAYTELAKKQNTISSANKLSADLISDGTNNKVYTSAEKTKLSGIASGAEVNVQSNWNESSSSSKAFIQNKPTKLSNFTNDLFTIITSAEIDNLF